MQKRGQISVFLILGLIVITLTALVLSFNKFISKESSIFNIDVKEIDNYIKDCIETYTEETINNIYLYGGYSNLEKAKTYDNTACLVYEENDLYKNKVPVISSYEDFLENELKEELQLNLPLCLDIQKIFNEYNINTKNLKIDIDIPSSSLNQDNLKVDVFYPIEIEKGEIKEQFSTFNIKFSSSLSNIYKYVNIISGDEAGSLNSINDFTADWCNTNHEGIQIKCIDTINLRKYILTDPVNNKKFYFGICK